MSDLERPVPRSVPIAVLFVLLSAAAVAVAGSTKPGAVVASQGGVSVTLADVDAFAMTVPEDDRATLFASAQRADKIVRNLLASKQLLHEARELGLQDDPKVAARMQQAADTELVKARMDALHDKIAANAPDLTELAQERYMANPSDYVIPAEVDVEHILVSTKNRSDVEAKALAEKLYAELQADPSQFAADVKKYSDDPSKAINHGLIENATSTQLVEPFREAAAKLTTDGQLSPPVKTRFGYHILRLVKRTPAKQQSFAQVRETMLKELRQNYIAKKVQHHLDVVRNRHITRNLPVIVTLGTRYAPATAASTGPAATPAMEKH